VYFIVYTPNEHAQFLREYLLALGDELEHLLHGEPQLEGVDREIRYVIQFLSITTPKV
jgi:hypothetical protein